MLRKLIIVATIIIATLPLSAQEYKQIVVDSDTLQYRYTPADPTSRSTVTFGQRLSNSSTLSNNKRVNLSFTVAPGYSANLGWNLVTIGDMLYRTKGQTSSPNLLSLSASASLTGYYSIGLRGTNHLGNDKHSLSYHLGIASTPSTIFGLNYATSALNRQGTYTERLYHGKVAYTSTIANHLLAGAYIDYRYHEAFDFDLVSSTIIGSGTPLFNGAGVGIILGIRTSRATDINLRRGVDITIDALYRPEITTNYDSDIWQISGLFDYYQPLWHGAMMAIDIYGEHHSENTPWMLRAKLGGDCRMRGYYPGQYNGNTLLSAQAKLRQRIARPVVLVAWGGAGTAFSKRDPFDISKILPNYGAGIRLYLDSSSVLRFDIGFGRGCRNFILGLNEAF